MSILFPIFHIYFVLSLKSNKTNLKVWGKTGFFLRDIYHLLSATSPKTALPNL